MRITLCLLLILAGCSDSRDVMDELPNSSIAGAPRENMSESRMEAPLARPVVIGEDGSRFAACGAKGVAIIIDDPDMDDDESLPELRKAPFANAKSLGRLAPGSPVFICTRSMDQKWLGVVLDVANIPGSTDPTMNCGLARPVETKRPYDGPCPSGWVSSVYVRPTG